MTRITLSIFLSLIRGYFRQAVWTRIPKGCCCLPATVDIVNRIMRGAAGHEKEYVVRVNRPVDDAFIRKMSQGVLSGRTGCDYQAMPGAPDRQGCFPHYPDPGAEPPDPAHVPGSGVQGRHLAADPDYEYPPWGNLPVGQWRHLTKEELAEMGRLIREGSKSKIIRSEEKTWNRK